MNIYILICARIKTKEKMSNVVFMQRSKQRLQLSEKLTLVRTIDGKGFECHIFGEMTYKKVKALLHECKDLIKKWLLWKDKTVIVPKETFKCGYVRQEQFYTMYEGDEGAKAMEAVRAILFVGFEPYIMKKVVYEIS